MSGFFSVSAGFNYWYIHTCQILCFIFKEFMLRTILFWNFENILQHKYLIRYCSRQKRIFSRCLFTRQRVFSQILRTIFWLSANRITTDTIYTSRLQYFFPIVRQKHNFYCIINKNEKFHQISAKLFASIYFSPLFLFCPCSCPRFCSLSVNNFNSFIPKELGD